MVTLTKLQWLKQQLTKSYNDSDTKEWIQSLLDGPLDIDTVHSMVLYELENNLKKVAK
jgi:uncharacterized membrane protein YebE (DUF533 family)